MTCQPHQVSPGLNPTPTRISLHSSEDSTPQCFTPEQDPDERGAQQRSKSDEHTVPLSEPCQARQGAAQPPTSPNGANPLQAGRA